MKSISKQRGFTALEVIIVIVIVALIALAGWWVYQNSQDDEATEEATQTQVEDEAPTVESTADLDNAEQYLEDLKIDDDLDTSEIDSALSY